LLKPYSKAIKADDPNAPAAPPAPTPEEVLAAALADSATAPPARKTLKVTRIRKPS
jgi:hypothetical protein